MLLLSNRKGDIFEELDIHGSVWRLPFGLFVNLHEISLLHPKIRGLRYSYLIPQVVADQ
jgi:hypothetical protein